MATKPCEQHNLWYDPAVHNGCIKCRGVGTPRTPGDHHQRNVVVAIAAVVSLIIAVGTLLSRKLGGSSSEEKNLRAAYYEYRKAMAAGDIPLLKTTLAASRRAELDAPNAVDMLKLAQAMYPANSSIQRVTINGASATIQAAAAAQQGHAVGTVSLIMENGEWKVDKEEWEMKMGPLPDTTAPARDLARPADFPKLRGTWKGSVPGNSSEWTVVFSDPFHMRAQNGGGDWYEGEVMIRWDLGQSSGNIRVPPGWAPLDIEIQNAARTNAVGKVVLAAFSLQRDSELRLCAGPPGHGKRVESFESPGRPFRCLVLKKTHSLEPSSVAADAPPPGQPAETARRPAALRADDNGPGEATVVRDGVPEQYVLKTGFFSDTTVKDPHRATLHFEFPAGRHSNSRRILLTLDATKTGDHFADGKAIFDQMFNDKPVPVGQDSSRGYLAVLKWQADGGQIYPPKESCSIRIDSAYTGAPDSVFSGEITNCTVHSAGIDHTLNSVKFAIRGSAGTR